MSKRTELSHGLQPPARFSVSRLFRKYCTCTSMHEYGWIKVAEPSRECSLCILRLPVTKDALTMESLSGYSIVRQASCRNSRTDRQVSFSSHWRPAPSPGQLSIAHLLTAHCICSGSLLLNPREREDIEVRQRDLATSRTHLIGVHEPECRHCTVIRAERVANNTMRRRLD